MCSVPDSLVFSFVYMATGENYADVAESVFVGGGKVANFQNRLAAELCVQGYFFWLAFCALIGTLCMPEEVRAFGCCRFVWVNVADRCHLRSSEPAHVYCRY